MPIPETLHPLIPALEAVSAWLQESRTPTVIVGAVAVGLLGVARTTKDIDAVALLETDEEALLNSLAPYQLTPRIEDTIGFAKKKNILLMQHEPTDSRSIYHFSALRN